MAKQSLTVEEFTALYVKLKGDEFAEGEISLDLSRKVTCITGEIDLMKLLRHITIAARISAPVDFHNRRSFPRLQKRAGRRV